MSVERLARPGEPAAKLRRSLTLGHAVLYGLGVTIGAGIYVLIGPAAGRAGLSAPLSFVIAAALMALTAASFAELAGRLPVAAGEAAYVRAGFRSDRLATATGLLVVAIAIVSAAAISVGSAGYILVFVSAPEWLIVLLVVLAMGAVAAYGIVESVTFAAIMTLIEVAGLLVIVAAGVIGEPAVLTRLPEMWPSGPGALATWTGVLSATMLAVFAFIGFEGLVNIAEEVEEPVRTLPRAIYLTLAITTALYLAVAWVALVTVPAGELAASSAPLAIVFERLTGLSPRMMSAIAIVATLNGVIVQLIMASRVLYGLAGQGGVPSAFGRVDARTQTPLIATAASVGAATGLALWLPLDQLADLTSWITLLLFALVNLALVAIKMRETAPPPAGVAVCPLWVPIAGAASCVGLLVLGLVF